MGVGDFSKKGGLTRKGWRTNRGEEGGDLSSL